LERGGFDAAFPAFDFAASLMKGTGALIPSGWIRNEKLGKRRRTRRTPKAPPERRKPCLQKLNFLL
jgi:hypothetical protein